MNTDTPIGIVSMLFVLSGIFAALLIRSDLYKNPQPMKIMQSVWTLTGLWGSWLALWAYRILGKNRKTMDMPEMDMPGMKMDDTSIPDMKMPMRPLWQQITLSTLHCGAGCTLADLIGEWFTFFIPVYIGGSLIAGQWVLDFILALVIGIYFQYAAIQSMERLTVKKALSKAFRADVLSLTSWQIGMYGWMAIVIFGINHGTPPEKNTWEFWFMMQIAMCFGFLTAWPVNKLLIRLGIKHGM